MFRASRRCLAVLVLVVAANGQTADKDPFDAVRRKIQSELEKEEIPSLTVAVARRGDVLWEQSFGWADRERKIEATPETPYSLASISKPITATGLMMLVERGRIGLDRPVSDYLGGAGLTGYAGDPAAATVRRVLSHSAGLPLHYQFFLADEAYPRPPMPETIRRYGILVAAPGERFQYSNLGYGILEYAIERVSSKAYPEFMRDELFLPLKLRNTSVPTEPEQIRTTAVRYWRIGQPLPFYDFDHRGGSAVFASARDLLRFAMFHLKTPLPGQQPVLAPRLIDTMQQPVAHWRAGLQYGLGWMIFPDRGGYRVIHHGGSMGGVRTNLSLLPDERIAVVVLANTYTRLVDEIHDDILAALLPRYGPRRRKQQEQQKPSCEDSPPPAKRNLPQDWRGEWAGSVRTYESRLPLHVWLRGSGNSEAELNQQAQTEIRGLKLCEGYLFGELHGDLGTADVNRRQYRLRFRLKRRGDVLTGPVSAISVSGPKLGNALTSWVELKRKGR